MSATLPGVRLPWFSSLCNNECAFCVYALTAAKIGTRCSGTGWNTADLNPNNGPRGMESEPFEIDKAVFTTAEGATEFIEAKYDDKRTVRSMQRDVDRAELKVMAQVRTARADLARATKEMMTLEAAQKTAQDLQTQIVQQSALALEAHAGLRPESAKLLTD